MKFKVLTRVLPCQERVSPRVWISWCSVSASTVPRSTDQRFVWREPGFCGACPTVLGSDWTGAVCVVDGIGSV